jgi:uncharacterized MAPEG superfamily protein
MTTELTVLTLAALLQCAQFAVMSVLVNMELGTAKTMSPRDPARMGKPLMDQVTPRTGRLIRALNNHFEGLILFTIAVLVTYLGDRSTGLSAALCWTYLGARMLYVPAYYYGLSPWRSVIWFVGWLATLGLLVLALL